MQNFTLLDIREPHFSPFVSVHNAFAGTGKGGNGNNPAPICDAPLVYTGEAPLACTPGTTWVGL